MIDRNRGHSPITFSHSFHDRAVLLVFAFIRTSVETVNASLDKNDSCGSLGNVWNLFDDILHAGFREYFLNMAARLSVL